jgi:hypothetical protein
MAHGVRRLELLDRKRALLLVDERQLQASGAGVDNKNVA